MFGQHLCTQPLLATSEGFHERANLHTPRRTRGWERRSAVRATWRIEGWTRATKPLTRRCIEWRAHAWRRVKRRPAKRRHIKWWPTRRSTLAKMRRGLVHGRPVERRWPEVWIKRRTVWIEPTLATHRSHGAIKRWPEERRWPSRKGRRWEARIKWRRGDAREGPTMLLERRSIEGWPWRHARWPPMHGRRKLTSVQHRRCHPCMFRHRQVCSAVNRNGDDQLLVLAISTLRPE
mmetsp:Transcript_14566/g.27010  ORF Transcript_14566/g.27010 Transcript_14566/m.27010 type:complete len:234 (-) Transcript_14566:3152-3853(-)